MSAGSVISATNLSKLYPIGKSGAGGLKIFKDLVRPMFGGSRDSKLAPGRAPSGMFWALNDVNFEIFEGERVGIVGRNGAGKSTLLKILSRVAYPSYGEAQIDGRVTALLEVGTGFNGDLSGRENIYLNASLHGLSRAQTDERLDDIIEFCEIRRFIDMPLGHYSTGMRARLAFSVAAHLDPDILILDEVLAVGDLAFQQKCLTRIGEMTSSLKTLLFVSHSPSSIMRYCDRCLWLHEGRVVEDGTAAEVVEAYSSATLNLKSQIEPRSPEPSQPREHDDADANEANDPDIPGAQLLLAKVTDANGDQNVVFPLNRDILIHLHYRRGSDELIVPGIALHDATGDVLFWSVPPDQNADRFRAMRGDYEATITIPSHLLNVGTYSVSITAVSPDRSPMKRHFISDRSISFQMVESSDPNDESRGILPRDFPGPLRPKLHWAHGQGG